MIFFFLYFFFGCDSQIQSPSSRIDTYIQDSSKEHILYIDVYLPENSKIEEEVIPQSKLSFKRHEAPQEQLIGRMQRTRYFGHRNGHF